MSKVNGKVGDIFVCYAEDGGPTFNIVTNGDEDANGRVDDGIYEYRRLTYQDMMDGEILDEMSKKHTLNGWEKYVNNTPVNSDDPPPLDSSSPPPSSAPSNSPKPPSSTPPSSTPPSSSTPPVSSKSPLPPGSSMTPSTTIVDPKNVRRIDIESVYPPSGKGATATNSMTHVINDIKKKSGTEELYLKQDDVTRALYVETDPNKKAIFQWINDNFDRIDKTRPGIRHDGFIGAGDLEKYFGITK